MRTLLWRELRRHATISLACLTLGVLGAGAASVLLASDPHEARSRDLATAILALVAVVGPLLHGVATQAPDSESGTAAFLATLPIPRGRETAARWAAGGIWSVVSTVVGGVLPALWMRGTVDLSPSVAGSATCGTALVAFSAGALSSVACGRTLLAFVVSPLFVLVPAFAYSTLAASLGAPVPFLLVGGVLLAPAVLAAALLAHLRGDVHRPSLRPLALGSGLLGGALLLLCAVTSGAYALDRANGRWVCDGCPAFPALSKGRRVFVEETLGTEWRGKTHVSRWRLVDLDSAQQTLWLPPGETPLAVSPGGSTLLALSAGPGGAPAGVVCGRLVRHDLTSVAGTRVAASGGEAAPASLAAELAGIRLNDERARLGSSKLLRVRSDVTELVSALGTATGPGWGGRAPRVAGIVWRGEEPRLVTDDPAVTVAPWASGEALAPGTTAVEAVAGSRVLLRSSGGARMVLDTGTGVVRPIAPQADVLEATLSPRGRYFVELRTDGLGRNEVSITDLDRPDRAPVRLYVGQWETGSSDASVQHVEVSFSPSEERVVVDHAHLDEPDEAPPPGETPPHYERGSRISFADLERGAVRALTVTRLGTEPAAVRAWSPRESRFLLTTGHVIDVDAAAGEHGVEVGGGVVGFADEETLVRFRASGELETFRLPLGGR